MQGFLEKLTQSKGKMAILGGAAIVGLFGLLYQKYKNDNTQQQQSEAIDQNTSTIQNFKLQNQIAKFRSTFNLINPTLQDIKQMLAFSFDMNYKQMERIHHDFKITRRTLKNQGSLKDYFKTVGVGMIRIRQISASLQQAIMADIGLTRQMLAPYQAQLGQFMYEQQMNRAFGSKNITLGEVKTAINIQLNFIKTNGDRLVSTLIQHCKQWQQQAKKYIPDVFTIYLTDQIALNHPEMDGYDMRGSQKRFEKYLVAETTAMKQQMQPKIMKLISELGIYEGNTQVNQPNNENIQQPVQ